MLIAVSNTLTVDNPSLELMMWCKRNLTVSNPEYAKKARMNLWLGNTPKVLYLYETRGKKMILPFGVLRSLPKEITDNAIFISEFASPVEVDFGANIPLYDYQEDAVQAMIDAQYGILQSAAGSGKTQMGIALAAKLGRRTLWLCHTLDLVKQSRERAEMYMDKSLIGTITEGKVNLGEGITFATIQTMSKLDLAQYKNYWDCIITDEVHRVSGSPTAVTQYQKRFVTMSESNEYGKLDEEKIKQLTGGEEISARALYQSAITFKPQFALNGKVTIIQPRFDVRTFSEIWTPSMSRACTVPVVKAITHWLRRF